MSLTVVLWCQHHQIQTLKKKSGVHFKKIQRRNENKNKTPLGNILDIDKDITLYNIKKWICTYTHHKMCQSKGSLRPMAVKPKTC